MIYSDLIHILLIHYAEGNISAGMTILTYITPKQGAYLFPDSTLLITKLVCLSYVTPGKASQVLSSSPDHPSKHALVKQSTLMAA